MSEEPKPQSIRCGRCGKPAYANITEATTPPRPLCLACLRMLVKQAKASRV